MAAAGARVPARSWRAATVIAGIVIVVALAAFVAARHVGFTAPPDRSLRKVIDLNRLGSLVLFAVGLIALAGSRSRLRALLIAAGVLSIVAAILVLIQTGHPTNWLGGRGNTFAFFVACAVAFVSLATVRPNAS